MAVDRRRVIHARDTQAPDETLRIRSWLEEVRIPVERDHPCQAAARDDAAARGRPCQGNHCRVQSAECRLNGLTIADCRLGPPIRQSANRQSPIANRQSSIRYSSICTLQSPMTYFPYALPDRHIRLQLSRMARHFLSGEVSDQ